MPAATAPPPKEEVPEGAEETPAVAAAPPVSMEATPPPKASYEDALATPERLDPITASISPISSSMPRWGEQPWDAVSHATQW